MIDPREVRGAWRALGRQLAGWRQAAGHTQEAFAPLVSYTRSSIANIETGKQHADHAFWRQADNVLGAGGTLVTGYQQADALQRRHRRQSHLPELRHSSHSAIDPAAPDDVVADGLDDLAVIDLRRQQIAASNVNEAKLTYLEEAVHQAIAANERRPPIVLVSQVRQLRSHVDHLLAGRQHPPQRTRLYTVAAYLSGLLGALALDLAAFRRARAYGDEAFELAEAVQDPDLQAWARAVQSLIAYYSGDFHDALALARDGRRRSATGPQAVRLAINGEARALARLGDRYGVDDAVHRAFDLLSRVPTATKVSESLTIGTYCWPRTAANAATAYLALRAPQQVSDYTVPAITAFDQAGIRGPQALSRLDLATATLHTDQPDIERACALVTEAMTLTSEQGFESVNQRARQFLGEARPWAHLPCMRDVRSLVAIQRDLTLPVSSAIASCP